MFRCDTIKEWTWRSDGRPASAFRALTIVRNWKDASAARALTIVRNSEVWRKEAQTLKWLSGRSRICIYSTGFIICNFVNLFCWVIKEELLFLLFIINRCNDSCWGAEEVLQSSADPWTQEGLKSKSYLAINSFFSAPDLGCTYRKGLISAGSISLDSTFNVWDLILRKFSLGLREGGGRELRGRQLLF